MRRSLLLVLLVACSKAPVETSDPDTVDSDLPAYEPECDPPGRSSCGDEASLLRGTVRLAEGLAPTVTSGTVVLTLTHSLYDGDLGGGYHIQTTVPAADLSKGPVQFTLDMCAGGAMWSAQNCEYGLVAVLDGNGNNTADLRPDPGEPATRFAPVVMTCGAPSPCLDVVLDCVDGASCVTFPSLGVCECEESTCRSDFALCN